MVFLAGFLFGIASAGVLAGAVIWQYHLSLQHFLRTPSDKVSIIRDHDGWTIAVVKLEWLPYEDWNHPWLKMIS